MRPRRKKKKGGRKGQQSAPNYSKQARMQAMRAKEGARTLSPPVPGRAAPSNVASLDLLAPIIVRSGRPLDGRSDADPARFPPPSTVAGCLRAAWARATDQPFGPKLSRLAVAGPLLLTRTNQVLVPKPADALYFGRGDSARCLRSEPRAFVQGCGADLPDDLLPVQLTEHADGKPGEGPAWWSWRDLLAFRNGSTVPHRQLCENGWTPPPGDRRTHVTINSETGAADAGHLFQTEGLDFDAPNGGLRLLVRCAEPLDEMLVHLGGKRRLAALQPEPEKIWPTPPPDWLDKIARAGGLSLTLLTPGIFSAGYRPGWLDANLSGNPPIAPQLRLQLCAAAVERWQPHSGWDLHRRRPRPSRKLAGAGTTYWFRILGNVDAGGLDALWLTNVSDLEQDRCDGFGLAFPAPWTPPR